MWMFLNPLKRLHHFSWLYNILLDFQHVLELAIHRGLGKRRKWLGALTPKQVWPRIHRGFISIPWHLTGTRLHSEALKSHHFCCQPHLLPALWSTAQGSIYNDYSILLQLTTDCQRSETLEIAVSNHLRLLATATWRWLQCDHLTQATVEVWSY